MKKYIFVAVLLNCVNALAAVELGSFSVDGGTSVSAEAVPAPSPKNTADCVLKSGKGKKQGISLDVISLKDEEEIRNLRPEQLTEVNVAGSTVKMAAASSQDDECRGQCRRIVAIQVDQEKLIAGYSNESKKVGVIHPKFKLSCIFKQ